MNIDPYKLMWAVVNFFILLAILNKFLYKPVMQMLEQRQQTVENSLKEAETLRREAQEIKERYEAEMAKIREESREIIARATKIAEDTREEIIAKAQSEAAAAIDRAQKEIAREKNQAMMALRDEVATLAVMAAGKVIGRALTPEDHKQMVQEFVKEVGDVQ